MEDTMESTANRKGQKIVITVARKPHGDSVAIKPVPSAHEVPGKAGDEEARDRLAVLASLYRILRG